MLLVLNLPMVGVWVRLLKIPYRLFYPAIVLFSCVGIYSVSNNPFDLFLAALFALLGYTLAMLRFELAPLLLGFILGPMMDENLRRALIISRGDFGIFVHEPISLGLLIASGLLLLITLAPMVRLGRDKIFVD